MVWLRKFLFHYGFSDSLESGYDPQCKLCCANLTPFKHDHFLESNQDGTLHSYSISQISRNMQSERKAQDNIKIRWQTCVQPDLPACNRQMLAVICCFTKYTAVFHWEKMWFPLAHKCSCNKKHKQHPLIQKQPRLLKEQSPQLQKQHSRIKKQLTWIQKQVPWLQKHPHGCRNSLHNSRNSLHCFKNSLYCFRNSLIPLETARIVRETA